MSSFVFDFPSVEKVQSSQLHYQSIQNKAKELARVAQEKKNEAFVQAYLNRMKSAIGNGIQELMESSPDKTFVTLNLSLGEKLVVKTDNGNVVHELYFHEVHQGVVDVFNENIGTWTSIPNPTFACVFKDLQKVMENNGYYLSDDIGFSKLVIKLHIKKPE